MKSFFQFFSRLLVAIFIVIPVGFATIWTGLSLIGFHVNGVGWQVAEKVAKKNGDVSECNSIIWISPTLFSPSVQSQRGLCIFEYAKLKEDPSACELLMPSQYGKSCLGAALPSPQCYFMSNRTFSWRDEDGVKESEVDGCLQKNFSQKGNDCCAIARINFLPDQNDCSVVKDNVEMHDLCIYELASKKRDPELCDQIQNEKMKIGCQLEVKYLPLITP